MSKSNPNIQMQFFATKSELQDWLARSSCLLLGFDSETPREFFGILLRTPSQEFRIGIGSFGIGIKPSVEAADGSLYVGFNDHVAIFSPCSLKLEQQIPLLSMFWQFIPSQAIDAVLVLCETALVALSQKGIRWRVDTDVIKTFEVTSDSIALTFLDDVPVRVDLRSGNRAKLTGRV
jgi:hypothetical protein